MLGLQRDLPQPPKAQVPPIEVPQHKGGNFRNSILIPESDWDEFRLVFEEYVKQCQEHD